MGQDLAVGLTGRTSALAYLWISLAVGVGCLAYGFMDSRFFIGGIMVFRFYPVGRPPLSVVVRALAIGFAREAQLEAKSYYYRERLEYRGAPSRQPRRRKTPTTRQRPGKPARHTLRTG
jgi:hypothetical protein